MTGATSGDAQAAEGLAEAVAWALRPENWRDRGGKTREENDARAVMEVVGPAMARAVEEVRRDARRAALNEAAEHITRPWRGDPGAGPAHALSVAAADLRRLAADTDGGAR